MAEASDAATELAAVAEQLAAFPARPDMVNEPGYQALCRFLNVNPNSSEFPQVIGAISRRTTRLSESLRFGDPGLVDDDEVKFAVGALEVLGRVFTYPRLVQPWTESLASLSGALHLRIKAVRLLARSRQPLKRFSTEELEQLRGKVSAVAEKLERDHDLDAWEAVILLEGLREVMLQLRYLSFFGHSAALQSMLSVQARARAFGNTLTTPSTTLREVVSVLADVVTIVCAADWLATALVNYSSDISIIGGAALRLAAPVTGLLPPPG